MKKYIPCFALSLLPYPILRIVSDLIAGLSGYFIFTDRSFYLIVISFNVVSIIVALHTIFKGSQ